MSLRAPPAPEGPALGTITAGESAVGSLRPAAFATVGMIGLLFVFLYNQSRAAFDGYKRAKAEAGEKLSFSELKYGSTKWTRTADRAVGNTMEQLPGALASVWLTALFVDGALAGTLGWLWILFRAPYALVFDMGLPYILLSTLPGYTIVSFGFCQVLAALLA